LAVSTIFAVAVFDIFIASNSIAPLRFIYDTSFALIALVIMYVSILLLRNREMPEKCFSFFLSKLFFMLAILLNLKAVLSIVWSNNPDIGFLSSNVLIQGANSLLPILDYSLLVVVNGIVLHVAVNRKRDVRAYEVPTYALCIVAIETSLALYGFQVGSALGLRLFISIFHTAICGIVLWLHSKPALKEIGISFDRPSILLSLFSVGLLMMIFIPYGIYNLFGDSSIIVGGTVSIVKRGSLQPYYLATDYYNPIGGFVAAIFAYSYSLSGILSASTLPFLASYLMLPSVVYFFLKRFVTTDSRMALIGTVMAVFMDGLAVLLLPAYSGNLTVNTVNWQISSATKSLYDSTIAWLWLTPFKTFSMASSIAVGNVVTREKTSSLMLAGMLFALSFANPRQPFVSILILIFLLGIRRLSIKGTLAILLSSVLFLGPVFSATAYKITEALLSNLRLMGLVTTDVFNQQVSILLGLTSNASLQIGFGAIATVLLAIIVVMIRRSKEKSEAEVHVRPRAFEKRIALRLRRGETIRAFHLPAEGAIFSCLVTLVFVYAVLHAYQILPSSFINLAQKNPLAPLNYLVLRYHVMVALIAAGFFGFAMRRHALRLIIALVVLAFAVYLGLVTDTALHAPLILVVVALPVLYSFVRAQKRTIVCGVLVFIVLGVFSASFYSATVKSLEPYEQPLYEDLPHVLNILSNQNPTTRVSFIATYDYYVKRVVESMADLKLTSNPSSVYIIDKRYADDARIQNLLNENHTRVLYQGKIFVLLEIIPQG
jgi:hypothetical protein